jgi:hypothetical protein
VAAGANGSSWVMRRKRGKKKGQGTIPDFGSTEADILPGSIIRKTVP